MKKKIQKLAQIQCNIPLSNRETPKRSGNYIHRLVFGDTNHCILPTRIYVTIIIAIIITSSSRI
jgi:hypothetical protein